MDQSSTIKVSQPVNNSIYDSCVKKKEREREKKNEANCRESAPKCN